MVDHKSQDDLGFVWWFYFLKRNRKIGPKTCQVCVKILTIFQFWSICYESSGTTNCCVSMRHNASVLEGDSFRRCRNGFLPVALYRLPRNVSRICDATYKQTGCAPKSMRFTINWPKTTTDNLPSYLLNSLFYYDFLLLESLNPFHKYLLKPTYSLM